MDSGRADHGAAGLILGANFASAHGMVNPGEGRYCCGLPAIARPGDMFSPPRFLMNGGRLERSVATLFRDYARMFKNRFSIETRFGMNVFIDQRQVVGSHMLSRGLWEAPQLARLCELIAQQKGGRERIFLDIGANWGLYSLYLHRQKLADRIIAFEPDPDNLTQLRLNLFMNDLGDAIEVVDRAVSDNDKDETFYVRGGQSSFVREGGDGKQIAVRKVILDDAYVFRGKLLIVKMDIENYEIHALRGMTKLLANNDVILQAEVFEDNLAAVNDLLVQLGFQAAGRIKSDHYYVKPSG
jgi:FkbM family methyltransferase